MYSFAVACASLFVMGVPILVKSELRDFDFMGCGTPANACSTPERSGVLACPTVSDMRPSTALSALSKKRPVSSRSTCTRGVFSASMGQSFHVQRGCDVPGRARLGAPTISSRVSSSSQAFSAPGVSSAAGLCASRYSTRAIRAQTRAAFFDQAVFFQKR